MTTTTTVLTSGTSHKAELVSAKTMVQAALIDFAAALSGLAAADRPEAFDIATQFKKVTEEVYDRLRDKLLADVEATGSVVTEKGTREAHYPSFTVRAIPTRTGTDPKKLEARLRSLGIDPAVVMDATITYKVNPAKLANLVAAGTLKYDEVAYEPGFRIQLERNDAG